MYHSMSVLDIQQRPTKAGNQTPLNDWYVVTGPRPFGQAGQKIY